MPSFRGQSSGLTIPFNAQIDTELLEASVAGVKKSARGIGEKFTAATKPAAVLAKSVKPAKDHIDKSVKLTDKLKGAFGHLNNITSTFNNTLSLAKAGMGGLVKLAQDGAAISRSRQGLFNLGADADAIERFEKILGGTVSKLQIAQDLRGAVSSGFGGKDLDNLGKTTAFLASQLSKSKGEMLGLLKNAELNDDQLKLIGLSAQKLDDALGDAADSQGRQLTATETRAVKLRAIIQGAKRASDGFTKSTKDAGDEGDKLLATFTNLKNDLARNLLPLANSMLSTINSWVKRISLGVKVLGSGADKVINSAEVKAWSKQLREGVQNIVNTGDGLKTAEQRAVAMRNAIGEVGNRLSALGKTSGLSGANLIKKAFGDKVDLARAVQVNDVLQKMISTSSTASGKQLAELNTELQKLLTPKKSGKANIKKSLGVSDAVREAKEELRGFRSEARGMLRNFDANFTDLVSNLGGSFSGVVSAMKEIPEKFRVLGSLPQLREGISKTLGMSIQQIDAQKTQLKLSNDQVKAAKLFNVALQAGKLDIEEYIGNEKAVNAQLKAGLSTLTSQSKIAQVLVEQNNLQKDVAASKLTIDLISLQLKLKEREITEKLSKAIAKNDIRSTEYFGLLKRLNDNQLKALSGAAKRYQAIGKERAKILGLTKQQALIEQKTEVDTKALSFDKQRNDLLKNRAALINEIKDAGLGRSQLEIINEASAQRIRDVQFAVKDLKIQATELQAKLASGLIPTAEIGVAKQRLQLIKDTIQARKEDITLIQGARDAQIDGLTVVGRMQRQFAETARNHNAELASNIIGMSQDTIGSVGGIITNFFTDLATNQENALASAGKAFLQVLAGMAAKLAAFYITTGTAQLFVPPFTGGGAIAAGLGLAALAAGLGVGASVVDTGGARSASAAGAAARTPSIQTRLPGLERPERNEPRRDYYLINGAPFLGSDHQVARKFKNWMEREGRNIKGRPVQLFATGR